MAKWVLSNDGTRWIQEGAVDQIDAQVVEPGHEKVAICVTAHRPYVEKGWLGECLASIEGQTCSTGLKILCLDDVPEFDTSQLDGWQIVNGKWGQPNTARNIGANRAYNAGSTWIWYMDADNIAPRGMLEGLLEVANDAPENCAIVYPGLQYCDEALNQIDKVISPIQYDYVKLRRQNYIDTCALWRVEAVIEHPWAEDLDHWDDWDIACRITGAGWTAKAAPKCPYLLYRQHPNGRWQTHCKHGCATSSWRMFKYSVVCLISGRKDVFDEWREALLALELPPDTTVYLVDDSGPEFPFAEIRRFADAFVSYGIPTMILPSNQPPFPADATELYRHQRVAALYTLAFLHSPADRYLTIEDDVIPEATALRRLLETGFPRAGDLPGALSAVYASAYQPNVAAVSMDPEQWARMPLLENVSPRTIDVGMVGAGFTLFDGPAMRAILPLRASMVGGRLVGWDSYASLGIRAQGLPIRLAGSVRCEHRFTKVRRPVK